MTIRRWPEPTPRREARSFIAMLWIAIATALLSAMPSGGLPASKTIGSAFDPATTGVVLRSRSQTETVLAAANRDAPPAPAHDLPALPPVEPVLQVQPAVAATVTVDVTPFLSPSDRTEPGQARAPPAA